MRLVLQDCTGLKRHIIHNLSPPVSLPPLTLSLSLSLSLSVVLNVVVISIQWVGGWQAAPSLRQSFCSVEEKGSHLHRLVILLSRSGDPSVYQLQYDKWLGFET